MIIFNTSVVGEGEPPVMLSGLHGAQTWCKICHNLADHNTLYHQDVINLHREQREDA